MAENKKKDVSNILSAKTSFSNNTAVMFLVIATVLWGSTFAFTKELTKTFSPIDLVVVRFSVTSALMFVIFFKPITDSLKTISKEVFLWLCLMGGVNFIAIILQNIGLKEIAASNSGFITSLSTLFVPIVEYLFWKKKVRNHIRIAILISIAGIYFMSYGFTIPRSFIFGDLITFLCAVVYAFHIILVGIVSRKIKSIPMMFFIFLITAMISIPFALLFSKKSRINVSKHSTILIKYWFKRLF